MLIKLTQLTYRHARRIVILVVGVTVVLFGIVAAVLPGIPAVLVIPLGLAILATEFVWAKRLLKHIKQGVQNVIGSSSKSTSTRADGAEPRP